MDIVKVATELSEFIHLDEALTKRVAKNAIKQMRRLRDAGELGQLSDLGKILNFKLKRPLTAAERTRNYRRRKRIQRVEVRSPKKRPYTGAERMQRYRERKKKAAQALNADVLNEEWVNDANSWDGVVIVPDNVPVATPLKKPFASDAAESNNAETSTTNESVLHNFTSTKPQLVVTNVGFNSKQKTSISAKVNETGLVQDIKSNIGNETEPATPCATVKSEDQSSPSVEPITTILLNGDPLSHIKCEPLDPCDVDESNSFEQCVTDKWTDESEFLHSNPLADVECKPSIPPTEKCVTFDKAVSITNLPIVSPGTTHEIHLKTNKRPAIVGSNGPENGISQSEDTVSSHAGVTCDLCKRSASNTFRLSEKHIRLLGFKFSNENVKQCSVCQKCKKKLSENGIYSPFQPSRNEDALNLFFGNSLWQAQAE